ncbi:MAG: alpha-galactosidase [Catenulispora sp.]|nr:alpha-galactosidase [Catenulispora sp.]
MTDIWEPYAAKAVGVARTIVVGAYEFSVTGAEELTAAEVEDDIVELELGGAGAIRVAWHFPCTDVTVLWTPESAGRGSIPAAWTAPKQVSLTRGAPVASLVGVGDVSRCTLAAREAEVLAAGGVHEETGEFRFWVQADRRLTLRVDFSQRHFAQCLAGMTAWWGAGKELTFPDVARMPAYSTWYSMHQDVTPEKVERQAALGKALGLDLIIVDDGWMTTDRRRGYGHCGDWEPVSLPDTAAHVARVHELGVEYMLWYAIPFIGRESSMWEAFQPYALRQVEHLETMVVDPRYPVVRAHLVERHARAVEAWGMDGLKIDFVDWFGASADDGVPEAGPAADCATVAEGVERLLSEIFARIRAARPTALVEFRQPYVSPGLWPYTTMIRAMDCPLSPTDNRQRTVDVRLAAGTVPVHSDMLLWHAAEPAEQVASHLINVLFSVPQISVDLSVLETGQREALGFWLGVFRRYRDVLQLGALEPARPDLGYPMVRAYDGTTEIVARYAALPVDAAGTWEELLVANADADPFVRMRGGSGTVAATVRDCRGAEVWEGTVELGDVAPYVPRGGLLTLRRTARISSVGGPQSA